MIKKAKKISEVKNSPKIQKRILKILYPQENEKINYHSYTIKIESSVNGKVEVSINGGPWCPCRFTDGFWWFDWSNYYPGKQTIIARVVNDKGLVLKKTDIRNCEY